MQAQRLYFDANIFIAIFEGDPDDEVSQLLGQLLSLAPRTGSRVVTSEITLAEVLVKPIESKAERLAAHYEQVLVSSVWLDAVAVDRGILRAAAKLRADHKALRLPDAIHVATALTRHCSYFVSGDTDVVEKHGLPVLRPKVGVLRPLVESWME